MESDPRYSWRCSCGAAEERERLTPEQLQRRGWQADADLFMEEVVPEHFRNFRLNTYPVTTSEQQALLDVVRRWVDAERDPWLLLWGPPGAGKTVLSIAGAYELVQSGGAIAPGFVTLDDYLRRIKASWRPSSDETEADVLEECRDYDLLILDDVGSEHLSEKWGQPSLFSLLNYRHDHHSRTVITSNLPPSKLARHVGAKLMGRVVELCTRQFVVSCVGLPDLRDVRGSA
jgi:DNA replication protein DnaC